MGRPTYRPQDEVRPGQPPQAAQVCQTCGCLVVDLEAHDEWHTGTAVPLT